MGVEQKAVIRITADQAEALKLVGELQKQLQTDFRSIANDAKKMSDDINKSMGVMDKTSSALSNAWGKLKGAWLEIAAAVAAVSFLKSWVKDAIDAEESFRKLKFQIEELGIAYNSVSKSVENSIQATSLYARRQDEEVAGVLQQMILITGDLAGSQKNLNLVFDLAVQKGIDLQTSIRIVGAAMTGNLEPMGRYFYQFKNINDSLGENVTSADKAAIGISALRDMVEGSAGAVSEYTAAADEAKLATDALTQGVGNLLLRLYSLTILNPLKWLTGDKKAIDDFNKMAGVIKILNGVITDTGEVSSVTAEKIKELTVLINEKGKKANVSEEGIKKVVEKVTAAYIAQGGIVGKNDKERKSSLKQISDLIDGEFKNVKKTEDAYKDFGKAQETVEKEILKRRIESDTGYIKDLKGRLTAAKKEYETFKSEVVRIEGEIIKAREEGRTGREAIRTAGLPQSVIDKEQAGKIEKQIKGATKALEGYDTELNNTNFSLNQIRGQLETGIKFDSEGNIKNAATDIEALKKSLDPQKFKETSTVLSEASDAINAGDYAEAARIITDAQNAVKIDIWTALLTQLSEADKKVVDIGTHAKDDAVEFDGTTTKIKAWGIATSTEIEALRVKILNNIAAISRDHEEKSAKGLKNLETELSTAETKLKTLVDMNKDMEFDVILKGYEEALDKKAELEKPTSSTHTIYTVYAGQNAPIGSNEAIDAELNQYFQGLSKGGDVHPIKAADGRHFPGYGGGDRIPILGEAGEYMMRKESVRSWGKGLFDMLNSVSPSAGVRGLSNPAGASAGAMEKLAVDLNLGGKTFGMNTNKSTGQDFANQIKKLNVLRGRYKQPY